ncbi:MAG: undecaprenyl-diphosphate phosphatase [Nanoarchaeota archaeon]|nr:undecaprenyl-diphosphate phosphatase [Nanoarchaeota archaeon]MBU1027786.1 undecaprenyl-diphosphate phosphatase [Nanoarchaeota archaeon]
MEFTILQYLILGAVQGITEWLPLSSSGMLVLILANFFNITSASALVTTSLFFHLGTSLAAIVYLRKEISRFFKTIFNYKNSKLEDKNVLKFLIVSTLISGILGIILVMLFYYFTHIELTGKTISFAVGLMLLFTGIIQIKKRKIGLRKAKNLKTGDSVLLGLVQGIAALPGLSRSGITVSTLLLRKFDDTTALKLSFLMSIPIVLIANIFLNIPNLILTSTAIYGLLASFVFGILTISFLMKLSKKINFSWFVIIFAILMLLSVFV